MKLKKRLLAVVAALAIAITSFSITAFADNEDKGHRPSIVSGYRSVRVGQDITLDVKVTSTSEAGSYTGGYHWYSDNERIATVSSGGTVTGHYPGTVDIRVELDNGRGASTSIVVSGSGYTYSYDDYDYWYDRYGYSRDYWGNGYYDDYGYWRYRTNPYNPDSSYYSSSSSSNSRSSRSSTTSSSDVVSLTETAPRETVLNRVRDSSGSGVVLQNYAAVSAETLQAAANISSATIHFDTLSGKASVGRVSFKAANASKFSGEIRTGVYSDTGNTQSVVDRFTKNFTNRTKVVLIDQRSFAAPVEICIRAGNLSAQNLYFYTYDASANSYNSLTVSDAYKDQNNYIHFTTTTGGYIIVSDGPLSRS